jgi:hypothetical protein
MTLLRGIGLALLALTVPPATEPRPEEPLAVGDVRPDGPLADHWTPRHATLTAIRVRLNGLGARTHANWVLFRLPFDATQQQRLRNVRFRLSSVARTDVGKLRIGSVCIDFPSAGDLRYWALYTASGIARTEEYRWHPLAPTKDPTILGVNVPTRLANYVACSHGESALREAENWSLRVDWEER